MQSAVKSAVKSAVTPAVSPAVSPAMPFAGGSRVARGPRIRAALAVATTVFTSGAMAAESADLGIAGTLLPPACHVFLSDGGKVDFGTIAVGQLADTAVTVLPGKALTMRIDCDAAHLIGISSLDARRGTAVDGVAGAIRSAARINEMDHGNLFGLGQGGNRGIGAYTVSLLKDQGSADGAAVKFLFNDRSSRSSRWEPYDHDTQLLPSGVRTTTWAPAGNTVPGRYRSIVQPLVVHAAIVAKSDLPDVADTLRLDGLATITVKYL